LKKPFESPACAWLIPVCLDSPARLKDVKESNTMKNIFVGNLDFAATDAEVRSLFERFGAVERVNLVTDRDTGRPRGFAFVEMTDDQQAEQAIAALNGKDLNGRSLNVNEARPKTAGGGGGRGFSGGGAGPRQRREPRW
jgi:RNA recognition motif-containing protein